MLYQRLPFAKNIQAPSLLFQVTCLVGLSWQLFEISGEYFKYKVNSHTTVFTPQNIEDLSMGICLPVPFTIDYNKFNDESQYNWTPDKFFLEDMLQNLTIHQIYNYTYNADKLLYNVSYWENVWGRGSHYKNLSSILKMHKYFFSSNTCYLYSIRSFNSFSVQWIGGGNAVRFYFGKSVFQTYGIRLFFAEKNRFPFRETIEARYIYRGNSTMKLDNFQTSHYTIREQLLPSPYETGCYSYSELNFTNSIECIERCLVVKSFKKWGAIPIRSLVANNALDFKFVRVSNYTKYYAELDDIRLSCQSICPNTSCDDTHIVTIKESGVHFGWDGLSKNNISFAWQRKTPSIPSATIFCRPTSTLTELILYIMSSVSTWTGLSMMSFNPILLLRNLSKIKSGTRISPLELRQRQELTEINHADRISRLEDCVASQNVAHDTLKRIVFDLLNNGSRSVR